jgi:putative redox protein
VLDTDEIKYARIIRMIGGVNTRVEVQHLKGITFVGKGDSNHWVVMDSLTKFGGSEAGTMPTELVLIALGGCTGMDVASALEKMRVNYRDFKITIDGERTDKYPKIFTKIHMKYSIYGDVPEDKLKRAIELSQTKYCSVSEILKKSAELTYEYEILR